MSTIFNKKNFIEVIAEVNEMKKVEAEKALNAVMEGLRQLIVEMEPGDKLQLLGDLTFEKKHVSERKFVNPLKRAKEGIVEEFVKPAHNKIVVHAGKHLQELAN